MSVRLKIEDSREGLVATISQRDDDGKITGRPSIFLVGGKEEAKRRAKAVARALGLNTYGVVDKTSSRMPVTSSPRLIDGADVNSLRDQAVIPEGTPNDCS
jgi:hypothetical protein